LTNADKLKNIISKKAKGNNDLSFQYYQMFFFEHILMRLEKSKYKHNIILKGGLLLSSIIGEDFRTTKDMDATLKSIDLEKDNIIKIFNEILSIDINDDITFEIVNVNDIRLEDEYGGFQINILSKLGRLKVNAFIEITSGDIITPREIEYKYNCIFEDSKINIFAYTIETIIAEKFETFISRSITNTRMKDFYDLCILLNEKQDKINNKNLVKAIENTFKKRKTNFELDNIKEIFNAIREDKILINNWSLYQRRTPYTENTNYDEIMDAIAFLIAIIESELIVL